MWWQLYDIFSEIHPEEPNNGRGSLPCLRYFHFPPIPCWAWCTGWRLPSEYKIFLHDNFCRSMCSGTWCFIPGTGGCTPSMSSYTWSQTKGFGTCTSYFSRMSLAVSTTNRRIIEWGLQIAFRILNIESSSLKECINKWYEIWNNKVTTRWEGPQSLSCNKDSLSKDELLYRNSCVIKFV